MASSKRGASEETKGTGDVIFSRSSSSCASLQNTFHIHSRTIEEAESGHELSTDVLAEKGVKEVLAVKTTRHSSPAACVGDTSFNLKCSTGDIAAKLNSDDAASLPTAEKTSSGSVDASVTGSTAVRDEGDTAVEAQSRNQDTMVTKEGNPSHFTSRSHSFDQKPRTTVRMAGRTLDDEGSLRGDVEVTRSLQSDDKKGEEGEATPVRIFIRPSAEIARLKDEIATRSAMIDSTIEAEFTALKAINDGKCKGRSATDLVGSVSASDQDDDSNEEKGHCHRDRDGHEQDRNSFAKLDRRSSDGSVGIVESRGNSKESRNSEHLVHTQPRGPSPNRVCGVESGGTTDRRRRGAPLAPPPPPPPLPPSVSSGPLEEADTGADRHLIVDTSTLSFHRDRAKSDFFEKRENDEKDEHDDYQPPPPPPPPPSRPRRGAPPPPPPPMPSPPRADIDADENGDVNEHTKEASTSPEIAVPVVALAAEDGDGIALGNSEPSVPPVRLFASFASAPASEEEGGDANSPRAVDLSDVLGGRIGSLSPSVDRAALEGKHFFFRTTTAETVVGSQRKESGGGGGPTPRSVSLQQLLVHRVTSVLETTPTETLTLDEDAAGVSHASRSSLADGAQQLIQTRILTTAKGEQTGAGSCETEDADAAVVPPLSLSHCQFSHDRPRSCSASSLSRHTTLAPHHGSDNVFACQRESNCSADDDDEEKKRRLRDVDTVDDFTLASREPSLQQQQHDQVKQAHADPRRFPAGSRHMSVAVSASQHSARATSLPIASCSQATIGDRADGRLRISTDRTLSVIRWSHSMPAAVPCDDAQARSASAYGTCINIGSNTCNSHHPLMLRMTVCDGNKEEEEGTKRMGNDQRPSDGHTTNSTKQETGAANDNTLPVTDELIDLAPGKESSTSATHPHPFGAIISPRRSQGAKRVIWKPSSDGDEFTDSPSPHAPPHIQHAAHPFRQPLPSGDNVMSQSKGSDQTSFESVEDCADFASASASDRDLAGGDEKAVAWPSRVVGQGWVAELFRSADRASLQGREGDEDERAAEKALLAEAREALRGARDELKLKEAQTRELSALVADLQEQLHESLERETRHQEQVATLTASLEGALSQCHPRRSASLSLLPDAVSRSVMAPEEQEWQARFDTLAAELISVKTTMAEQTAVLDRLGIRPPYGDAFLGAVSVVVTPACRSTDYSDGSGNNNSSSPKNYDNSRDASVPSLPTVALTPMREIQVNGGGGAPASNCAPKQSLRSKRQKGPHAGGVSTIGELLKRRQRETLSDEKKTASQAVATSSTALGENKEN